MRIPITVTAQELQSEILTLLREQSSHVTSAGYVVDELDRQGTSFTLDEFDTALIELQDRGEIRLKNRTAPLNDWQIHTRA